MENKDIKTLQKKVLRTKSDLRKWETTFEKKHGRQPGIPDIQKRPEVEKFYKKYNQLKKELKEELLAESLQLSQSQNDTQGSLGSSCSTRPGSPERQVQRKSSVEFIRSPSQGSRMKASVFESKQNQRRLSAYEEIKSALKPKQYTEEQAFWLDLPAKTTSASQPTSTSNSFSFSQPTSNTQPSQRLVLGSSQPQRKKNFKQQKLFGRNPFQRALSSSQEVVSTVHPMEDPVSSPISSQTTTTSMMDLIPDDDEDDDMEGIEIVTHEIDPFRKYDPSLFHWEDPSFSIGPGFFSSVSPFYLIPMLNEPSRRIRVLEKLEKGTLGEVLEENRNLEQNLDQDIRDFIANNTEPLETIESALAPIDENLLNTKEYIYKKKPLQKRQTRLHRMKFVG